MPSIPCHPAIRPASSTWSASIPRCRVSCAACPNPFREEAHDQSLPQSANAPRSRGLPGLPPAGADFTPERPAPSAWSNGSILEEAVAPQEASEESFECADPKLREAVLREQMKFIQSEIGKSHKGWGQKLIDLLGP